MENIHQLGLDTLLEVGESVTSGNVLYAPKFQYLAINHAKDEALIRLLETWERYRTLIHSADTPMVFNLTAGDPFVGELPPNFVRHVFVQILTGGRWVTIEERRPAERDAGVEFPSRPVSSSGVDMTYHILGRSLFIDPPLTADNPGALRIYQEQDIPDLLVGNPAQNSGANTLFLATTLNEAIGQRPALAVDGLYAGLEVDIVGTPEKRNRILSYTTAGNSRLCTMKDNWFALPTMASLYAMVVPLPRMLVSAMKLYAAMQMMTNAKEDASAIDAKYEKRMKGIGDVLSKRTPGSASFEPLDIDDW